MTKKEALRILIEQSFLFSDEAKAKLLVATETMSDEEIEALGVILAKEKQIAVENNDQMMQNIDALIKQIDEARKDE
jgi:hypothetical protein